MEFITVKKDSNILITISGRLDTSSSDEFLREMTPVLEGDEKSVEIDCTNLEYVSSQGLRIFLMLQKKVVARQGQMTLVNLRPYIKEVFHITGFTKIINII
ncbi:MAG: STAS domain-containing protein [Alistipes sp.]|nr:STAS domain-containing protein [Candidatus Alistipes equi]